VSVVEGHTQHWIHAVSSRVRARTRVVDVRGVDCIFGQGVVRTSDHGGGCLPRELALEAVRSRSVEPGLSTVLLLLLQLEVWVQQLEVWVQGVRIVGLEGHDLTVRLYGVGSRVQGPGFRV
jgi:hypothetical protein